MLDTTLCYIERDGKWLMLHRVKKKNDLNHDKWVGVGGKFEPGETAEQCLLREVHEETGLTLTRWRYCGIITFLSDRWESERMHLYTADGFTGTLCECNEGTLEWVDKRTAYTLPMWAGDVLFFREMEKRGAFFRMSVQYEGERLVAATCDGKNLLEESQ